MTEPHPDKPVAGDPNVPPPAPAPVADPVHEAAAEPPPPPAQPRRPRFERVRRAAPAGALGMLVAGLVGGLVGGGVVAIAGSFGDDDHERGFHKRPDMRMVVPDGRWKQDGRGWQPYDDPRPRFRQYDQYPREAPMPLPQVPTAVPQPPSVSPSPVPSRTA